VAVAVVLEVVVDESCVAVCSFGSLVVVVLVLVVVVPVSGDTQGVVGALDAGGSPGRSTVPAHPKFDNVVVLVMREPSENVATEVVSRMNPASSTPTLTSVDR
jgi:hypothetical protein